MPGGPVTPCMVGRGILIPPPLPESLLRAPRDAISYRTGAYRGPRTRCASAYLALPQAGHMGIRAEVGFTRDLGWRR